MIFIYAKDIHSLKPQKIEFEIIDKKFITEFLNWIVKIRKCSDATRNLRLSNIKAFFAYVQTEVPSLTLQTQRILQVPKKRIEQKVIEYITPKGMKLILSLPNKHTYVGIKHLVLLSFMFATGARVQEVIDVTINDFKYNGSEFIIPIPIKI